MAKRQQCAVVADCDCKAAGDGQYTRAHCFACGDFVCTNPGCSAVLTYYGYGRKRICSRCQDMHGAGRHAFKPDATT